MEREIPVLIAGGSFGGAAAAIGCARMGIPCMLVSDSDWLGGQATAQGVPLDEHPWIEQYGCTRQYRIFRNEVRNFYRKYYRLSSSADADPFLNPGACWVSALGFEPQVGLNVLKEMLRPYESAGLVQVFYGWKSIKAETDGDRVQTVCFEKQGEYLNVSAQYVLDATETGELLPMTGTEYAVGAESVAETQEPLALDEADPLRQQPLTHLIAVHRVKPGTGEEIPKPENYDQFSFSIKGEIPEALMSEAGKYKMQYLFPASGSQGYIPTVWNFRRSLCAANFIGIPSDITMLMNGNEYQKPILDVPKEIKEARFEEAKQMSLSLLYYIQHELGSGYADIQPCYSAFGTVNGLAAEPYIRESRRIRGVFTVLEQHFRKDQHPDCPVMYGDSVGLGGYRIDIHEKRKNGQGITTSMHGMHWQQQIPLGAFIPVRMENLLPACKNIAVTHVTNGAFRLHPVEWNIGEVAGMLAAYAIKTGEKPRAVREDTALLEEFQRTLLKAGIELEWPQYTFGRSYFSHYEKVKDWYFGEAGYLEDNICGIR